MYTCNGVDYLGEQIQSIFKQDLIGKADIGLYVWDDGSTDKTTDILDRYKGDGKLEWFSGEKLGMTKAFWHLMEKAGEADYYAFCEQYDVWFPEKLSRAVKYLETKAILEGEETEVADTPLLYCSECKVTNAGLRPVNFKRNPANKFVDYEHSLIYSAMPGGTYVFNVKAKDMLLRYDVDSLFVPAYEDLSRNIISIVGNVVYDRVQTMYLRKLGKNRPDQRFRGGLMGQLMLWISHFTSKELNTRSKTAKALMEVYRDELEGSVKIEALKQVGNYTEDTVARERLLLNTKFVTGSYNDKWFKSAVKANKL